MTTPTTEGEPRPVPLPSGFSAHTANIGIKDTTKDFLVLASDRPAVACGVFTRSRFAGPSVTLSRRHLAASGGVARAVVVVSKNANVANGERGERDAAELVERVGHGVGVATADVVVASTGVIGRPYPMDRLRAACDALVGAAFTARPADVARAIMTTDTVPKLAHRTVGAASVVGVAKGVGMIEPDMATLLGFVFTDAQVDAPTLDTMFRESVERTFNCLSVDSDTSTSDTAVVLASGAAGAVDLGELGAALHDVLLELTLQLARDGEGATKLLEVRVDGAADRQRAKRVAKAIVNSPLVKTAVHGADPNWGRVAMAVGKCWEQTEIGPDTTVIRFGHQQLYPEPPGGADLGSLTAYLRGDHVVIHVTVGHGPGAATVWGCDLSREYVAINADYTT